MVETAAGVRTYRYRWVIMIVLWLTYVVAFIQRLGVGPLAPFLKDELGLTSTQVGSLLSAASAGYMLSVLPAGLAVDRIGVRRLLLFGQLIGGIFMIAMFIAPSFPAAIFIMVMSGLGTGCIMPSTTKALVVWFPPRERATMMGLRQTGVNVAGMVAAAALPALALALGWRYGFLFLGILAIAIGITSAIIYREPPDEAAARPETNQTDSFHRQFRKLAGSRELWLINAAGFGLAALEFSLMAYLVLYLTEEARMQVMAAGSLLALTQAAGIIGKPASGILSDRLFGGRRKKVFMLWSAICLVSCLLLTVRGTSLSWGVYPVLFLLGATAIGWGGLHVTMVAEIAGKELVGTATGISSAIVNIGSIGGPIVFGYLVDRSGSYQSAWLAATLFSAMSLTALAFVREDRRRI